VPGKNARHLFCYFITTQKVFGKFGSRARGEAKKGADWDILIVLPKSRLEQSDYDDVSFPFVELGWKLNEQIIHPAGRRT